MSLTSLVREDAAIVEKLNLLCPMPTLQIRAPLIVPPTCADPALVGTAYDYLLRILLKRYIPFAVTRDWVALRALNYLATDGARWRDVARVLSQVMTMSNVFIAG